MDIKTRHKWEKTSERVIHRLTTKDLEWIHITKSKVYKYWNLLLFRGKKLREWNIVLLLFYFRNIVLIYLSQVWRGFWWSLKREVVLPILEVGPCHLPSFATLKVYSLIPTWFLIAWCVAKNPILGVWLSKYVLILLIEDVYWYDSIHLNGDFT